MPSRRSAIVLMSILPVALIALLTGGCSVMSPSMSDEDRPTVEIDGQTYFVASLDEWESRPLTETMAGAWLDKGELTINFTLAQVKTTKYRRPYVAVWIEDRENKPVRFLTLWGKQAKYHRDLRDFWVYTKRNTQEVDAVTGPTRGAGAYSLTWDGNDGQGKPMPAGEYTVHLEVVREHGTRVHMKKAIACGGAATVGKIEGNVEVDGVQLSFGKAKSR